MSVSCLASPNDMGFPMSIKHNVGSREKSCIRPFLENVPTSWDFSKKSKLPNLVPQHRDEVLTSGSAPPLQFKPTLSPGGAGKDGGRYGCEVPRQHSRRRWSARGRSWPPWPPPGMPFSCRGSRTQWLCRSGSQNAVSMFSFCIHFFYFFFYFLHLFIDLLLYFLQAVFVSPIT